MAAKRFDAGEHMHEIARRFRWVAIVVAATTGIGSFCFLASFPKMPIAGALFISMFLTLGTTVLEVGICNNLLQKARSIQDATRRAVNVAAKLRESRKPND